MWQSIERAISAATGQPFKVCSQRAITGGCINEAVCLHGEARSYFIKLNQPDRLAMFEAEAAGLEAIGASHSLQAPRAIAWGVDSKNSWLAMEYLAFASARSDTNALLGRQLAAMHRCSAAAFGWDRDNTIGRTPQPNARSQDWAEFFAEQRLGFQLALAEHNGAPGRVVNRGQLLLGRVPWFFRHYQPQPSLLHGDLWGGNWAADTRGQPVIFDPAVYFGDREADLAMTELFGGFDESFYLAYNAAWPLDGGYQVRKVLYQLYHILNHFNLFGGAYARQAESMIERLLAASAQ